MRRIIMRGNRYGRLLVLRDLSKSCLCRCDCGVELEVQRNNLRSGNTESCGCYQKDQSSQASMTHGKTDSEEYRIWLGIMSRCYNPKRKTYPLYGGVGIVVVEQWHNFQNFLDDMGPRPTVGHTIDRFPNKSGNYEPGNCRWATMKEQGNNRKSNVLLTKDGKTQTARQWEEELGLGRGLIHARLKLGWSAERALSGPIKKRGVRKVRIR